MTKHRIEKVFDNVAENVRKGGKPNVSTEMLKAGYSPHTAHNLKITRTKTWQECLKKYDDELVMDKVYQDAISDDDKRNATANRMIYFRIKDLFPKDTAKIISIFDKIDSIMMTPEEEEAERLAKEKPGLSVEDYSKMFPAK